LYPELSNKIYGALIDVFKEIGGGHLEKYYQKAVALSFKRKGLTFVEQKYVPVVFDGEKIGKYFFDFFVENLVIVELKRGQFIPASLIEQTTRYLKAIDVKLAIIGCFTSQCVILKRVVNER